MGPRHLHPGDDPAREIDAALVGRLYDAAFDPMRLEAFLHLLDQRLAALRTAGGEGALEEAAILPHAERGIRILDRAAEPHRDHSPHAALAAVPRVAAFLATGGAEIAAANRAAVLCFRLPPEPRLDDLPFGEEDRLRLRDLIRTVAAGRGERVVTESLRSRLTDGPVILRIARAPGPARMALVSTTEIAWSEGFDATVRDTFGLTAAETEIVRGPAMGWPVRDIALSRERSAETVRTQIRSILSKTGTHSQSELVRVVSGLMALCAGTELESAAPVPGDAPLLATRHLPLGDGRQIAWAEWGAPEGRPLLFLHDIHGLLRWPEPAMREARAMKLRVIAPLSLIHI